METVDKLEILNKIAELNSKLAKLDALEAKVNGFEAYLNYIQKLSENIINLLEEGQKRSRRATANSDAIKRVFNNHPALKANPGAANLFNDLMSTFDSVAKTKEE